MADVQKTLTQPGFQQFSSATPVDMTMANAISDLGGRAAQVVVDNRVEKIGAAFDKAQSEIQEQQDAFKKKEQAILDSLVDERDQGRVKGFMNEYDKLHAGEVQGTLSPTEASIRREALYRKYASAFPSLKKPLKEVSDSYAAGAKLGAADDPVAKARAALIEKSVTTGIPVPQLIEREQYKQAHELRNLAGVDNFAGLQVQWNMALGVSMMAIDEGMRDELTRTGGLDSAKWEMDLIQKREQLKRQLNAGSLATAREMGFNVSREDLNALQADIDNAFNGLITAAKSGDLQTVLDRNIKMQQSHGIQSYIDNYGPIGALAPIMGAHAFPFFNEVIPNMFDAMTKHGNMNVIRQLAKTGDRDAAMFVSMLDSGAFKGGKYIETLLNALGQDGGATGLTSGNKHEQSMWDAISFSIVETFSKIPDMIKGIENGTDLNPDSLSKRMAISAGATRTIFKPNVPTETIVRVAKSPDFRAQFRKNPEMRKAYNEYVAQVTPELKDFMMDEVKEFNWTFSPTPEATRRDANGIPNYFYPNRIHVDDERYDSLTLGDKLGALGGGHVRAQEKLNAIYHSYRITAGEAEARKWAANMLSGGLWTGPSLREPEEITDVPDGVTVESADDILKRVGE